MLQVFTMRGKTKVSYYITFFQTLLRTFSCDLCYSDRRIILSHCEKMKVNHGLQEEQKGEYIIIFVLYSFHRTTKVSCYKYLHCRGKTKVSYYILLREKQKYHITSRSSKRSWKRFSCLYTAALLLLSVIAI